MINISHLAALSSEKGERYMIQVDIFAHYKYDDIDIVTQIWNIHDFDENSPTVCTSCCG